MRCSDFPRPEELGSFVCRSALEIGKYVRAPYYIYSLNQLQAQLRALRVGSPPGVKMTFAMMANDNPTLLRWYRSKGLDLFAGSLPHLKAAARLGFPRDRVVAGATNLDFDDLKEVAAHARTILLDSLPAVDAARSLTEDCEFLVRVDAAEPSEAIGRSRKLGLPVSTVVERWTEWRARDKRIVGLHGYAGTNVASASELGGRAAKVADLACKLDGLRVVDVGGGFPACSTEAEGLAYLRLFWEALGRSLKPTVELRIEPGRFLVGSAGYFACNVTRVEQRDRYWYVGTNGSVPSFPRRLAFGAPDSDHPMTVAALPSRRRERGQIVVAGCSTFSRDVLWSGIGVVPKEGEVVLFKNAGAYCRSSSLAFLGIPASPEFQVNLRVDGGETIRPLRFRESAAEGGSGKPRGFTVLSAAQVRSRGESLKEGSQTSLLQS